MKIKDLIAVLELEENSDSILEVLFDYWYDNGKHETSRVEDAYKEFCHSLLEVDPFQIEKIMGATAVLCMEHEFLGFVEGIKQGVRLINALK